MKILSILSFHCPPYPTFIKAGVALFDKGDKHFYRSSFSVFDLIIVKSGTLYMHENGYEYEINPNQYLLLAPGHSHGGSLACKEKTVYEWVHFSLPGGYTLKEKEDIDWSKIVKKEGTYTRPASFEFQIPRYSTLRTPEPFFRELDELIALSEEKNPATMLKQQMVFSECMRLLQIEAVTIPTSAEQVTNSLLSYIHAYYQQQIKISDIAKELLFHPDYLTRCMQKTMGITPVNYLNQYRMIQAKRLLATSNKKVNAIGKEVGIQDETYFSRLFKQYEGISPTEYRRGMSDRKQKSE
ncbi:AraC family transcriptional regulator [Bacillus alkalicellulosilyticus]|uniref:AraC family transcriptional regulator n=1 Tax=Alkalihalobacterium alkalicellulosilyticum TaxID=1912214 RepID=UPI00099709CF|nr:AraC family transcriptional regulator [Bacillus alkalicellulosilyticus]